MPPRDIEGVIRALDDIVGRCHESGSRLGYFPALYRKTTREVQRGLDSGRFRDPELLERLDVVFAERYLDAYRRARRGEPTPGAWDYAFRMAASRQPTVIQHLLLGMNAHINLDLAISAAEVAPGAALPALKHDFDVINDILGELVDRVQEDLAGVFPLVRALDFLCLRLDEAAVHLAVRRARASAWEKARTLAGLPAPDAWEPRILAFDREVVELARTICPPPGTDGDGDGPGPAEEDGDPAVVRRIIESLVD